MSESDAPAAAEAAEFLSSAEVDRQLVKDYPGIPRLVDAVSRRKRLLRGAAAWRKRQATQEVFAERFGSEQPDVSRLELGKVDPKLSTMERYAAATGANFFWQVVDDQGSPVSEDFMWAADIAYRRRNPGLGPVPPPLETPREVLFRLVEALNNRDYGSVAGLYSDRAELRVPDGNVVRGREGIAASKGLWSEGLPDLQIQVAQTVVERSTVFGVSIVTGTHTGTLLGLPPTGRRVSVFWLDMLVIDGGRIASDAWFFDRYQIFEQLGLIPAPATSRQYA